MTYVRNAWYPIAWQEELKEGQLLARTLLDTPVVLFKADDGQVKALRDRCPHRFLPLSMGTLCENQIQCRYHGLVFNGDGQCTHNPHGDGRIPRRAQVHSYPVLQRYHMIWLWMGDIEQVDASLLPSFDYAEEADTCLSPGYMHVSADYRLEIDNILDLSHIEYLHPYYSSPAVSQAEVSFSREGDQVWSHREMLNDDGAPDFIRQAFKIPEDEKAIDRWLDVSWDAPALLTVHAYGGPSGVAKDKARETNNSPSVHWFTPETAGTTHYFFAFPVSKRIGEAEAMRIAEAKTQANTVPFADEDKPVLEAQARELNGSDLLDEQPIILQSDTASMWARRALEKRIQAEQVSN